MKIGGFQGLSTVDWPGGASAVVFLQGCNLNCPWCHNRSLIPLETPNGGVSEDEVFRYLAKHGDMLDGVVVTGGEPTIHAELSEFLGRIRKAGFAVKLDSNGTNPGVLKRLIEADLIQALAMDIKAAPERYGDPLITGSDVKAETIRESMRVAVEAGSKIKVWFRTTTIPHISPDEIEKIRKEVNGFGYVLLTQTYIPPKK